MNYKQMERIKSEIEESIFEDLAESGYTDEQIGEAIDKYDYLGDVIDGLINSIGDVIEDLETELSEGK